MGVKSSTVTVSFDEEKLSAVRRYMLRKEMNLDEEMEKYLLKLYERYVPSGVQEYISERTYLETGLVNGEKKRKNDSTESKPASGEMK